MPSVWLAQAPRVRLRRPRCCRETAPIAAPRTGEGVAPANHVPWNEVDASRIRTPMNFMPDQFFDGRLFRILTVVDIHTREALVLVPRVSFRAYQVIDELDRLAEQRGRPLSLQIDNGPEFAGRMLDQWA